MNRVARVVVTLLGLLLVAGCGPGLKDVPLPGTGVSGATITVRADFAEALNLAEGATVKVNGVDSGKVQSVAVEDFHARAEMLGHHQRRAPRGRDRAAAVHDTAGRAFRRHQQPRQGGQAQRR